MIVPTTDLVVGDVYPVNGRNFRVGVYVGPGPSQTVGATDERFARFIGIRQKFDYRYLTTELAIPLRRLGRVPGKATLDEKDKTLRRSLAQYEARATR